MNTQIKIPMKTYIQKNNKGFTLIELMVTIVISGIFYTIAFNLFKLTNSKYLSKQKTHEIYFEFEVQKAKANKIIKENPWECIQTQNNFEFSFKKNNDKLNQEFPFDSIYCTKIHNNRFLIYYYGKFNEEFNKVIAWSVVKNHLNPDF